MTRLELIISTLPASAGVPPRVSTRRSTASRSCANCMGPPSQPRRASRLPRSRRTRRQLFDIGADRDLGEAMALWGERASGDLVPQVPTRPA
jgi:hypothetical protein